MPTDASNLEVKNSESSLQADSKRVVSTKGTGIAAGKRFRDLYCAARVRHGDLAALSETTLANIVNELDAGETRRSSAFYALSLTSATFITLIFVPLLLWLVGLSGQFFQVVGLITSNSPKLTFIWHPLLASFPLFLAIATLIPLLFRQFPALCPRFVAGYPPRYDSRNPYLRRMLFAVIYIETGAIMLWIAKLWIHGSIFLSNLILIWTALPFAVLLLFGSTRMGLLVIAPIVDRERASIQRLASSLLQILCRLDELETLSLIPARRRRWLAESLVRASQELAQLFEHRPDPANAWANEQLRQAADNILCLAAWIYLPKHGTLDALRAELIRYFNILVSGNLDEWPRQELPPALALVVRNYKLKGWRKVATYSVGAIYLVLPPLALGIAGAFFSFQLTAAAQAVLWLIYLIWIIIGAPFFFERISPEARALASDLLHGMFGKK